MLPGVELARRRRVHYHGDAASSGEHHHHHAQAHRAGAVAGPALAARIRLEEKLRGAALPSPPPPTSPSSRWSRLMRDAGRPATSTRQHQQSRRDQRHQEQNAQLAAGTADAEPWLLVPPPPGNNNPAAAAVESSATRRRRAELTRTLSKVEVCAVCLEEVREHRRQRVTRLPCSHKYHSECVLPWLAIQPDCPCCRAIVPSSVHTPL